jgi:hypothetical protein
LASISAAMGNGWTVFPPFPPIYRATDSGRQE